MNTFIFIFLFSFSAFATSTQIVTSFSILNDLVKNITPDSFQVDTLVPPNLDSHGYQALAKDYLLLRKADLIILVGENFDPWATSAAKKIKSKALIYYVTNHADLIPFPKTKGTITYDPHFWQSPQVMISQTLLLSEFLKQKYPGSKSEIETKTNLFLNKLKDIQTKYATEFSKLSPNQRKMIVAHNSFQYFAREFNVLVDSPLDANQEGESSLQKITALVKKIKTEKITSLFYEKSSPEGLLNKIASSADVKISGTLYSDCLSSGDPASTYLKMINYNFDLILKALKGQSP